MNVSFRDPAGALLVREGRVLRLVNRQGEEDISASLGSAALQKFVDAGRLVTARRLEDASAAELLGELRVAEWPGEKVSLVVEHERIPFQSYPYEWPPEMLHAAGALTLDLAEAMLAEGRGLKDATPYNVLFRGPQPVFVDWLSFERREPTDPTWLAYAQFVRTFLLPLLVTKQFGVGLDQILLSKRDGLEPEEVYRLCGWGRRLKPPFLTLATIPTQLGARKGADESIYRPKKVESPEKARFILEHQFKQLRRLLAKVEPEASASAWAEYMGPKQHFTDEYLRKKEAFVERALGRFRPQSVLDVGCNTGHFSRLAARGGARVVSLDQDPVVVGSVWKLASAEGLDILPLTVDVTRPSPGVGWLNAECPSFLDRARGNFDAVLMLAVIHHMLVSERVPLPEILKLASELTRDALVVEFVGANDPMFRRLTRGREQLFEYLSREFFEETARRHFDVLDSEEIAPGDRWIYLLKKK
jgi:SAM-dependent methyltransferase